MSFQLAKLSFDILPIDTIDASKFRREQRQKRDGWLVFMHCLVDGTFVSACPHQLDGYDAFRLDSRFSEDAAVPQAGV
ncbi:MAG: hypothetical protein EKK45_10760 [Curvibacter sp.]|nr:MAG: hypothetical protein EKK45_10760 [Curvibacter sp.]